MHKQQKKLRASKLVPKLSAPTTVFCQKTENREINNKKDCENKLLPRKIQEQNSIISTSISRWKSATNSPNF